MSDQKILCLQAYFLIAKERGYLNSNNKNENLATWQIAALVEHLCRLCGIFEKWQIAALYFGGKANTYRIALRRARETNPSVGDFELRLARDFQ